MTTEEKVEDVSTPIVIDLGKKKRRRIRQLKRGRGPLVDEIGDVVEQVKANMGPDGQVKHFIPIVMVYRRKKGGGRGFPFF